MDRSITVRNIHFGLAATTPRYWFDDDPAKTHFMNALSSTFPGGEAFFVRSVLHYLDRIESPELREQIRRFGAQEGVHAREHAAHVDYLVEQGYVGIERINEIAEREMRFMNKWMPKFALATTAALEHLTAIMANQALSDPTYWAGPMHENMAPLWQWHAMEEAEHKAVAFDVLAIVSGSYALRAFALVSAGLGLLTDNLARFAYFTYVDGNLWNPRVWRDCLRFVWGRKGLYRSLIGDYLAWFRRDFHPWQQDNSALIEAQIERMSGAYPSASAAGV
jgi:predicted metal-dependent hydrolase